MSAGASVGSVVAGDAVVATGCVDTDDESSSLEHDAATTATTTPSAMATELEPARRLLIFVPPIGDRWTVATNGPPTRIEDERLGRRQQVRISANTVDVGDDGDALSAAQVVDAELGVLPRGPAMSLAQRSPRTWTNRIGPSAASTPMTPSGSEVAAGRRITQLGRGSFVAAHPEW